MKNNFGAEVSLAVRICIGVGLLVSCLVALRLYKSDEVRIYNEFTHKIDTYVASMDEQVTESIAILHSLKALFDASEEVTRAEFRKFASFLLHRYPSMRAVGWIPRVAADQRHDMEAQAQQDGFDWFQITERREQGEMIRAGERDEYYPIYFIEPLEGNRAALAFDLASSPTRRTALFASRDTGKAHLTCVSLTRPPTGNLTSCTIGGLLESTWLPYIATKSDSNTGAPNAKRSAGQVQLESKSRNHGAALATEGICKRDRSRAASFGSRIT